MAASSSSRTCARRSQNTSLECAVPLKAHLRLTLDEAVFDDAHCRDDLLPERFDAAVTVARSLRGTGLRLRCVRQSRRVGSRNSKVRRVAAPKPHAPSPQSRRRTVWRKAPSPPRFRRRYVAPASCVPISTTQRQRKLGAAGVVLQASGTARGGARLLLLNTTPRVIVFNTPGRVPGSVRPQPCVVSPCTPHACTPRSRTAARVGGGSAAAERQAA